jgi:hypothetical protein
MEIKKIILAASLLITFESCQAQVLKNIAGTYVSKSYPALQKIILTDKGQFVVIRKLEGISQYTDTLTFGSYALKNDGLIEVNSFYQEYLGVQSAYLKMKVKESVNGSSDSICFLINNKLEEQICNGKSFTERPIYYTVNIKDKKGSDLYNKILFPNVIRIPRAEIDNFSFQVVPNIISFYGYLGVNSFYTEQYFLVNKNSNFFAIDFPILNLGYISSKRLYSEFMFMKANTITWSGELYQKIK